VALAVTLSRRLLFLDNHSIYLVVIRDDRPQIALALRSSRSTLESIKNILEAVVNIMHEEGVIAQINANIELQSVVRAIRNTRSAGLLERLRVDQATPLVPGWIVRGNPKAELQ
jgi:hypothetical protein